MDVYLYKLYLPNGVATETVGETTAVGKAVENINRKINNTHLMSHSSNIISVNLFAAYLLMTNKIFKIHFII